MASVDDVQLGIHHFSPTFLKRSQNEDILSQNQQKTGPRRASYQNLLFRPPGRRRFEGGRPEAIGSGECRIGDRVE